MRRLGTLIGFTALCIGPLAWAQGPAGDPLADQLFPPDVVMQQRQAIGLTAEQQEHIAAEVTKVQAQFEEMGPRMQQAVEALAGLMKVEQPNEEQVLAQLDTVLERERAIKRLQLGLAIRIKRALTPEQQAALRKLRGPAQMGGGEAPNAATAGAPVALPPQLQQKLQQVQQAAERWQREGRDMSSVAAVMNQFEPLIREGRFDEASSVLDRALATLSVAN